MFEHTAPVSTANSEALSPSLPNSDLFSLSSPQAIDSPVVRGRTRTVQRHGAAHRSSPLARFPPVTPESIAAAAEPLPRLKHKLLSVFYMPASTETLSQPLSHTAIGLGHPSASKRRSAALKPDPVVSPKKRARINSSTIQCRPEHPTTRTPYFIVENNPTSSPLQKDTPRLVPEARRRSYVQATSEGEAVAQNTNTDRRVAPAIPTISGSTRCARQQLGGTSVSSITALASWYTPQAGPTQVQSCVLLPATTTGAPKFESFDVAVFGITAATDEEEKEVEEKEFDGELIYGEDLCIQSNGHAHLAVRFAARRLKTLF
ncbi:hypothetical protein B0H12DRAFT_711744 [Mycena haematopus]|nr:hypothetical protein B0H12DRAFT_711744 [Mycena haematopus]